MMLRALVVVSLTGLASGCDWSPSMADAAAEKASGSIDAAMCQKHALDHAPAQLEEDAPELLRRCIDEFAGGQTAKGPALPTKRPG